MIDEAKAYVMGSLLNLYKESTEFSDAERNAVKFAFVTHAMRRQIPPVIVTHATIDSLASGQFPALEPRTRKPNPKPKPPPSSPPQNYWTTRAQPTGTVATDSTTTSELESVKREMDSFKMEMKNLFTEFLAEAAKARANPIPVTNAPDSNTPTNAQDLTTMFEAGLTRLSTDIRFGLSNDLQQILTQLKADTMQAIQQSETRIQDETKRAIADATARTETTVANAVARNDQALHMMQLELKNLTDHLEDQDLELRLEIVEELVTSVMELVNSKPAAETKMPPPRKGSNRNAKRTKPAAKLDTTFDSFPNTAMKSLMDITHCADQSTIDIDDTDLHEHDDEIEFTRDVDTTEDPNRGPRQHKDHIQAITIFYFLLLRSFDYEGASGSEAATGKVQERQRHVD